MKPKTILLLSCLLILCGCAADIDPSVANTPAAHEAIKWVGLSAALCLGIGIFCIISGIVLVVMGINGSIDLSIELVGISTKLINASPGILLIIVGFIIILVKGEPSINITKRKNK